VPPLLGNGTSHRGTSRTPGYSKPTRCSPSAPEPYPHSLNLNAREHPRSLHAGVFSAAFTHGNVAQLAAVHRRVLAELATRTPAVFDEAGCLWVAANATYVVRVVSFPAARAATSTLSSEVTTRSAPAAASAT
jgi:hypothetical protein